MCAPTISGLSILAMLSLWRFAAGFGIGGDYPMSSVISAEFATVKNRGLLMGLVFSMQGLGTLVGIIVTLVTLSIFKTEIQGGGNIAAFDHVWRICVVFCVVPAIATLYFRLTLPESPRYTLDVVGDHEGATKDAQEFLGEKSKENDEENCRQKCRCVQYIHTWANFKEFWSDKVNVLTLIGTAGPWFFIDIAIYVSGWAVWCGVIPYSRASHSQKRVWV